MPGSAAAMRAPLCGTDAQGAGSSASVRAGGGTAPGRTGPWAAPSPVAAGDTPDVTVGMLATARATITS